MEAGQAGCAAQVRQQGMERRLFSGQTHQQHARKRGCKLAIMLLWTANTVTATALREQAASTLQCQPIVAKEAAATCVKTCEALHHGKY
jgi:hypothetical protein